LGKGWDVGLFFEAFLCETIMTFDASNNAKGPYSVTR
jgi:hypothetical protein